MKRNKAEKWVDKHWGAIEEAIYAASVSFCLGIIVLVFFCALPGAVDQMSTNSRAIVAASTGKELPK